MLSHFTLVWWRRELWCCWIDICRAGLSFSILSRSACSIDGIRIHYAYALITTMSDLSKFNYEIPSHAPVLLHFELGKDSTKGKCPSTKWLNTYPNSHSYA